jgi:NAD(P)-dependent dehydrogenase (short-subunit alcohol dehydrogenase family)
MRNQYSVDGQTAIITGSSQGIGAVTAKRFADDGADVVITSRSQDRIDRVAREITESDRPGRAIAVECDVRNRDEVEALVNACLRKFGTLDTMVNNAGASFMAGFDDISPNGWETIVDINLHGTYHCSQVAGAAMQESGSGSIINFSSVAGIQGAPRMSHYGAAKAGVINLTKTLAYEYASHDIRVNCVAPGLVATPGVESQMGITVDEVDRDTVDRHVGLKEEIADVVQFLASDASSYLVGETLTPCGVPDIQESPDV